MQRQGAGYHPHDIYQSDQDFHIAIDLIATGVFSHGDPDLFLPLVETLIHNDPFMVPADCPAYCEHQAEAGTAYRDQGHWSRMAPRWATTGGAPRLKSMSGFVAYRRKYHGGLRPIDVVEFVVTDPDVPRSLTYCVNGMDRALDRIGTPPTGAVRRAMSVLRAHLTTVTSTAILDRGLHEYLDDFLVLLTGLTTALQSIDFAAHLSDADKVEAL